MKTLSVYPNPWSALDRENIPCGACPRDPDADGGGPGQYVGARVDRGKTVVIKDTGGESHDIASPIQRTRFEYLGLKSDDPELATKLPNLEPVIIPRTAFYKKRLLEKSLIPADEESAKAVRMRFVPAVTFFARFAPKPAAAPAEAVPAAATPEEASPALAPEVESPAEAPKKGRRNNQPEEN